VKGSLPNFSGRRVDSWKNFLPRVRVDKSPLYSPHDTPCVEYDHEANSGLTDFNPEVTWVTKRYMPLDERTYAPVPRHKYMLRPSGVPPPPHWIPPRPDSDPEVAKFSKLRDENHHYSSTPYTRDERWSTLREMLPSSGHATRRHPPAWGTGTSIAPRLQSAPMRRFPVIDSPMTRFVSDMHLTNREFKQF